MRSLALIAVVIASTIPTCAFAEETNSILDAGRDIYHTATRSDGTPVKALVQQDVPLPAGTGACVSCHRRSGLGLAEGGERALNITGAALFQPRDVPPVRVAYDEALLTRAIVGGVDANGEPLSQLMPRYQMTPDDIAALSSYLRSLGADPAPGVNATELFIATIITPDSADDERLALENIIPEYVTVKNGGTRQESRRSAASARHFYGIKRYQAYREWRHSFWELEGKPETWPSQLQRFYEASPPFAILSGSIGDRADIVHDFCEEYEVACILPMTHTPPAEESGFYSLYYSSGVRLESEVIAKYLVDNVPSDGSDVVVVYNDDIGGNAAMDHLREKLPDAYRGLIRPAAIKAGKTPSTLDWAKLLKSSSHTLVLLISSEQMRNLASQTLATSTLPDRILTTQSFTNWSQSSSMAVLASRVLHVYPYSLPAPGRTQFPREEIWLRSRGIELSNNISAAKVVFACKALGMALADIQSNFTREYLLESLEHALDSSLLTSLYPRTTLGPDQRFLSRGAYLSRLAIRQGEIVVSEGDWVQP